MLFSSQTSEPSRKNLPPIGDEFFKELYILVINWISRLDWRKPLLEEGTRHFFRNSGIFAAMSLDLLMRSGLIAVFAELFDFQPFGGVPSVLL